MIVVTTQCEDGHRAVMQALGFRGWRKIPITLTDHGPILKE
jgi:hypothetical protein